MGSRDVGGCPILSEEVLDDLLRQGIEAICRMDVNSDISIAVSSTYEICSSQVVDGQKRILIQLIRNTFVVIREFEEGVEVTIELLAKLAAILDVFCADEIRWDECVRRTV
jgi:hypothetical protein